MTRHSTGECTGERTSERTGKRTGERTSNCSYDPHVTLSDDTTQHR